MTERTLRARAVTTHWEPPTHGLDEDMWTARDPETGCAGLGKVEAEAYGNLAAAVHHYEAEGSSTPYTKYPGQLHRRPMGEPGRDSGPGAFDWLFDIFRRD